MKIGFLGPAGTFTEKLAKEIFPDEVLIPLQPIRKVVLAVETGEVDSAVVPIENIYNGEVRQTLDSLTECNKTKIVREFSKKIVHCIGAPLDSDLKQIKKVYSKDQALEQCSKYLIDKLPKAELISVASTSEAARIVSEQSSPIQAVIASENALNERGLNILDKDLCPNNQTRFIALSQKSTESTGNDKTFVALHPEIKDKPGILYNSLKFISGQNINLEYIQSRPDGENGYYFYLELEGHEKDEKIKKTLEKIKTFLDPENQFPNTLKILGSYSNTNWKH
ncbi:MAG: prephenate dehydratase [Nanoarchaeota archaeon]